MDGRCARSSASATPKHTYVHVPSPVLTNRRRASPSPPAVVERVARFLSSSATERHERTLRGISLRRLEAGVCHKRGVKNAAVNSRGWPGRRRGGGRGLCQYFESSVFDVPILDASIFRCLVSRYFDVEWFDTWILTYF